MLIKLLLTLLGEYSHKEYNGIDQEKMDEWLLSLMISPGWESYFRFRDLQIMKSIANGVDNNDYWRLVGQRQELLFILGSSKRVYDRDKQQSKRSRERDSEDVGQF